MSEEVDVIPVDPDQQVGLADLLELNSDAQWAPQSLGARMCGVTHDSGDAGFASKSCLMPGLRVVDGVEGLALPVEDGQPDPAAEQLLRKVEIEVAERSVPVSIRLSPAAFLEEPGVREQLARMQIEEAVDQLQRWYDGFCALPGRIQGCYRNHYRKVWDEVLDELGELEGPWVDELFGRLEAIEHPPSPVEATAKRSRRYARINKSARASKTRPKRRKKQTRSRHSARSPFAPGRTPAFS